MSDFKVGDRVKVTRDIGETKKGTCGRVESADSVNACDVRFEDQRRHVVLNEFLVVAEPLDGLAD